MSTYRHRCKSPIKVHRKSGIALKRPAESRPRRGFGWERNAKNDLCRTRGYASLRTAKGRVSILLRYWYRSAFCSLDGLCLEFRHKGVESTEYGVAVARLVRRSNGDVLFIVSLQESLSMPSLRHCELLV